MKIFNLTQHPASEEQLKAGVIEPCNSDKEYIKLLLTFNMLPNRVNVVTTARELAKVVKQNKCNFAMIGGAPFLMPFLAHALICEEITPLYAFSERKSEEKMINGRLVKTSIFVHKGFVDVHQHIPIHDLEESENVLKEKLKELNQIKIPNILATLPRRGHGDYALSFNRVINNSVELNYGSVYYENRELKEFISEFSKFEEIVSIETKIKLVKEALENLI